MPHIMWVGPLPSLRGSAGRDAQRFATAALPNAASDEAMVRCKILPAMTRPSGASRQPRLCAITWPISSSLSHREKLRSGAPTSVSFMMIVP